MSLVIAKPAVIHESARNMPQQSHNSYNGLNGQRHHSSGQGFKRADINRDDNNARSRNPVASTTLAQTSQDAAQPVRRRISRACDQCNQLRTKCDGKSPCAHCTESNLTCEYARERKKRGKASRKDIEAQRNAGAVVVTPPNDADEFTSEKVISPKSGSGGSIDAEVSAISNSVKRKRSFGQNPRTQDSSIHSRNLVDVRGPASDATSRAGELATGVGDARSFALGQSGARMSNNDLPSPHTSNMTMSGGGVTIGMGDYGTLDDYHRSILHPAGVNGNNILHNDISTAAASLLHGGSVTGYGDASYATAQLAAQRGGVPHGFSVNNFSPPPNVGMGPSANSPGWLSLPSPSALMNGHMNSSGQPLRYPVLRPLLPHISAIIPISLACDLLELYFSSMSYTSLQPNSPYVHCYIFRKRSMLRQDNPRPCSPALLASMLWLAAQTSESAFFTSPPSARGKICQKLLELTIGLLKPLIHTNHDGALHYDNTVINGVALGGLGVALPGNTPGMYGGSPGATGALDDVATYMHLATVVSASEYKAASIRWWNAAWTLARELKLGRELPPNPDIPIPDMLSDDVDGHASSAMLRDKYREAGYVSEEEREERRRIWWLLYIMDRHLALCYNRPLFLLDIECETLFQPDVESRWQDGESYPPPDHAQYMCYRARGPVFECTGHNIYGCFLPIMTILGEIVDLNIARNHPRMSSRLKTGSEWNEQVMEIERQLETYGRSLQTFALANAPSPPHTNHTTSTENEYSASGNAGSSHAVHPPMSEAQILTKIVVAYGTHLMHTMHILLNGRWDPITLLDDEDLWISSPPFMSATGHAVSAAQAIDEILDYDPDISFMPYFFGIYLLQASFLLLLIADKLRTDASPGVIKACETIVRAHEACVVTLDTEYQRNFRKVMRSALSQVKGRGMEDFGEQQAKRREVLALYRWTGDGTGLAL